MEVLPFKKGEFLEISSRELVELYGFKVEEKSLNWSRFFEKQKIGRLLAALAQREKERMAFLSRKREHKKEIKKATLIRMAKKKKKKEREIKPLKQIVTNLKSSEKNGVAQTDKVDLQIASTVPVNIHKKPSPLDDEYSPFDLSRSPPKIASTKRHLSPMVKQAIDRAYDRFDSLNDGAKRIQEKIDAMDTRKVSMQSVGKKNPKKDAFVMFDYSKEEKNKESSFVNRDGQKDKEEKKNDFIKIDGKLTVYEIGGSQKKYADL